MQEKIFEINQSGKTLTSQSGKIFLNKYENDENVLHFNYDNEFKNSGYKYLALKNPDNNLYTIEFIDDETDNYYITTNITKYTGIWEIILLITDGDYQITDSNIDESKLLFVSNIARFLVVKGNFLNDTDAVDVLEETMPGFAKYLFEMQEAINSIKEYIRQIEEIESRTWEYDKEAESWANQAKVSAEEAKTSKTNASIYQEKAKIYSENAASSERNAANSASSAEISASDAANSATNATSSANSATSSATNADISAKKSEAYAHGGVTEYPECDTDNSKYWCDLSKTAQESVASNKASFDESYANFNEGLQQNKEYNDAIKVWHEEIALIMSHYKKQWIGTKAQYDEDVSNGLIEYDTIVFITDDEKVGE